MKYKGIIYLSSLLFLSLISCGDSSDDDTGGGGSVEGCSGLIESAIPKGNNDVLIWADEFNTDGSPCSKNWGYDLGAGGWGNNELQFYTASNVSVENGSLKIKVIKEPFQGSEYTSSRIKSQSRFSFTYGKVEVRAKLPNGGGTWPAIWMLGDNITSIGWPACGEIDIMEHVGNRPGWTSSAIHNPAGYGGGYFGDEQYIADATSAFHVYGVIWTQDKIEFTVDDEIHFTYSPDVKDSNTWPFTAKQFLILNIAMGGNLGGNIPSNFTNSTMEIDYVRVYQ
jgi:beta-glucanase (GH16 family)